MSGCCQRESALDLARDLRNTVEYTERGFKTKAELQWLYELQEVSAWEKKTGRCAMSTILQHDADEIERDLRAILGPHARWLEPHHLLHFSSSAPPPPHVETMGEAVGKARGAVRVRECVNMVWLCSQTTNVA